MPGERRTEEEIRRQIAAEREQLAEALADLRTDISSKRRAAAAVGGSVLAAAAVISIVKRFERRS